VREISKLYEVRTLSNKTKTSRDNNGCRCDATRHNLTHVTALPDHKQAINRHCTQQTAHLVLLQTTHVQCRCIIMYMHIYVSHESMFSSALQPPMEFTDINIMFVGGLQLSDLAGHHEWTGSLFSDSLYYLGMWSVFSVGHVMRLVLAMGCERCWPWNATDVGHGMRLVLVMESD